jgi:hypothetical protein
MRNKPTNEKDESKGVSFILYKAYALGVIRQILIRVSVPRI